MNSLTLPLEALNHALASASDDLSGLVYHSDRGSQYASYLYTQRLRDRGIRLSVGSMRYSYDKPMAEAANGLYQTELIHPRTWNTAFEIEHEATNRAHWWNNAR